MINKQHVYLILAFLGLVATWYFNLQFYLTAEDTSLMNFIALTGDTFPALSIKVDIAIAAITFLIWMILEGRRLQMKRLWVYAVLTFLVAFAFSFPLFLYFRERKLQELNKQ